MARQQLLVQTLAARIVLHGVEEKCGLVLGQVLRQAQGNHAQYLDGAGVRVDLARCLLTLWQIPKPIPAYVVGGVQAQADGVAGHGESDFASFKKVDTVQLVVYIKAADLLAATCIHAQAPCGPPVL